IESIRKFMPWIRKIYLVTDQQRPGFLDEYECERLGVEILDHSVIFSRYEWALPTFNSISIVTALHRIPKLADRYICFNDDVIVLAAVREDDLFVDGKVVRRGTWQRFRKFG